MVITIISYILSYLLIGFIVHCGLYKFNMEGYRDEDASDYFIIVGLWPLMVVVLLYLYLILPKIEHIFTCVARHMKDFHKWLEK